MSGAVAEADLPEPADWDPIHHRSSPGLHWTTSNVGEAIPGVVTPLCWSIWGPGGERGLREACRELGIVRADEAAVPARVEDRWVSSFFGRVAMQVEFMALVGDRLPGTSGEEAVSGVFGRVPPGMEFSPTRARYLPVACRWPYTFFMFPRRLRALVEEHDRWGRASVDRCPTLALDDAVEMLVDANHRFNEAETLQTISVFGVVQPAFDALSRLITRAGTGDLATLSGTGGAELEVVTDLWRASRGKATADHVIRRHGFHGPLEGELSSVVWREDPTPVLAMIERYAERPDSDDPVVSEQARDAERRRAEGEVLSALPRRERPVARAILAIARKRIPMRGVAKRAFLQALDVCRAAARQIGYLLAEDGTLERPDDVFFLTIGEIQAGPGEEARVLVARRRERRELYRTLRLPGDWTGDPTPTAAPDPVDPGEIVLAGVGVSSGTVTGVARVITTPEFGEIEPDEILVAPTTDPSWASIMFISAGLVVDIGGPLSHAAVVARELGLPCVVNTKTGTTSIRTGDRIRIDGDTGSVEVLDPAVPCP